MSKTESLIDWDHGYQRRSESARTPSDARQKTAVAFLVIGVLLASGCGAVRPSKYYQLALPNDLGSTKAADPIPITLLIGRLKASHLYREDRIVYSSKNEQMGTYEYQRWAEPPTEMIDQILLRELRASGHFAGVYTQSGEAGGDYLLHGSLFDFKEVSGEPVLARLSLELALRDMKTGNTVWTHSYSHDELVDTKDISGIVAALSKNVQRAVNEIRVSLDEYFASHPSK
jgi:cholesterol transport system auxiliary component